MERAPGRRLGLALWLLAGACAPTTGPKPPDLPAERTREELVRFGGDELTVESFSVPTTGWAHQVDNGQHYRWWVWVQPFVAQVRWRRDAQVRTREEIASREGQPGWTLDETARSVQRLELLGGGIHPSGSASEARGVAVYERVDDTWRLRAFSSEFHYYPQGHR
jgi:hypothetical protein